MATVHLRACFVIFLSCLVSLKIISLPLHPPLTPGPLPSLISSPRTQQALKAAQRRRFDSLSINSVKNKVEIDSKEKLKAPWYSSAMTIFAVLVLCAH